MFSVELKNILKEGQVSGRQGLTLDCPRTLCLEMYSERGSATTSACRLRPSLVFTFEPLRCGGSLDPIITRFSWKTMALLARILWLEEAAGDPHLSTEQPRRKWGRSVDPDCFEKCLSLVCGNLTPGEHHRTLIVSKTLTRCWATSDRTGTLEEV